MQLLVSAAIIVFLLAGIVGWLCHRWHFWDWVDLIYYPLAAIGIALLFFANDAQRELFELTQSQAEVGTSLVDLRSKKPDLRVSDTAGLLDGNVEHIAVISKWGDICTHQIAFNPRCYAVKNLTGPVAEYLKVAQGTFSSYEERLFRTCNAADKLLLDTQETQALSTLVTEKLLTHYMRISASNLSSIDYDAFSREVDAYKRNATDYADQIQRAAFRPEDASGQRLWNIRQAEIEFGEVLLRGMFVCLAAPREQLSQLRNWTTQTSSREQEVARLEAKREQIKAAPPKHPTTVWIQLYLWPLVLILALSLKFAKGAATVRKARIARRRN